VSSFKIENFEMMKLTIFTPTHNRATLLPRLYESLKKQTDKNFEWLIIDDGSNDDTPQVVSRFTAENAIEIRYYFQKNHGKHTAINNGVSKTENPAFFIVDSDDMLSENAVAVIREKFEKIKDNDEIAGIACGRVTITDLQKLLFTKKLPQDELICHFFELNYQYHMQSLKLCGEIKNKKNYEN
jgi:glycosyltransferase involved in cell wall biosynthesis